WAASDTKREETGEVDVMAEEICKHHINLACFFPRGVRGCPSSRPTDTTWEETGEVDVMAEEVRKHRRKKFYPDGEPQEIRRKRLNRMAETRKDPVLKHLDMRRVEARKAEAWKKALIESCRGDVPPGKQEMIEQA